MHSPSTRSSSDSASSGASGGQTIGIAPAASSAFRYLSPSAISCWGGSPCGVRAIASILLTSEVVTAISGRASVVFMRSTFSVCLVPQTAAVGGSSLAGGRADRQRHPASRLWPAGQARDRAHKSGSAEEAPWRKSPDTGHYLRRARAGGADRA